jgi:hypothetical protein
MERRKIKIEGDDDMILSVTLRDLLELITISYDYNWSIIWLWATGDLRPEFSISDLQKDVKDNANGVSLTWDELNYLSRKFSQVIDLVLVADKDYTKLKKYATDEEMNSSCDYVIELIDSSYWIINSVDIEMLDRMVEKLPGVSYIK